MGISSKSVPIDYRVGAGICTYCVLSCISSEEVRGAVLERLSEASVENNHACLLDACVEAASRYET